MDIYNVENENFSRNEANSLNDPELLAVNLANLSDLQLTGDEHKKCDEEAEDQTFFSQTENSETKVFVFTCVTLQLTMHLLIWFGHLSSPDTFSKRFTV